MSEKSTQRRLGTVVPAKNVFGCGPQRPSDVACVTRDVGDSTEMGARRRRRIACTPIDPRIVPESADQHRAGNHMVPDFHVASVQERSVFEVESGRRIDTAAPLTDGDDACAPKECGIAGRDRVERESQRNIPFLMGIVGAREAVFAEFRVGEKEPRAPRCRERAVEFHDFRDAYTFRRRNGGAVHGAKTRKHHDVEGRATVATPIRREDAPNTRREFLVFRTRRHGDARTMCADSPRSFDPERLPSESSRVQDRSPEKIVSKGFTSVGIARLSPPNQAPSRIVRLRWIPSVGTEMENRKSASPHGADDREMKPRVAVAERVDPNMDTAPIGQPSRVVRAAAITDPRRPHGFGKRRVGAGPAKGPDPASENFRRAPRRVRHVETRDFRPRARIT